MEPFTITTKLTREDYFNELFVSYYRGKINITIAIIGAILLAITILQALTFITVLQSEHMLFSLAGFYLLLRPIYKSLYKSNLLRTNKILRSEVAYTFTPDAINVKSDGYNASISWDCIYTMRQTDSFLLLYTDATSSLFINKTNLNTKQVEYILSKKPSKQ